MRAGKSDFHSANKIKRKRKTKSELYLCNLRQWDTVIQYSAGRQSKDSQPTTPLPLEMIYFLQHLFNTGCNPI
jgi:hypothetical protein